MGYRQQLSTELVALGSPMRTTAPVPARRQSVFSRTDRMKPLSGTVRPLRIAATSAGLLGGGITAARFASIPPSSVLYLSISAAVCAIAAGTAEIVRTMAARSPETRRMAALQHLARKASSPEERLSAMAMLSLTTSTSRIERKDMTELMRMLLDASRRQADVSELEDKQRWSAPSAVNGG